MLSGRYPSDYLARHWNLRNMAGLCLLEGCTGQTLGSLEHILLQCPALSSTRQKLVSLCLNTVDKCPPVATLINTVLNSSDETLKMQFLLDCFALPAVVTLVQSFGQDILYHLFYVSRNWCYSVHRKRMDLLGLYQYR